VCLISAGQAPDEIYMATMIDSFRKYIGCFQNIKEGGIVFGYGTCNAGDVKGTPAMERANNLLKDWLLPGKLYVKGHKKVSFVLFSAALCLAALRMIQYFII
jgi:hypothetical protein